jgi:salicylate hydroxylase
MPHLQIHRWDYQTLLYEEVIKLGAQVQLGTAVSALDLENGLVKLDSGKIWKADLIIGADGGKSICRGQLLEHYNMPRRSGEVAIRLTTGLESVKKNPQTKELLKTSNLDTWMGPGAHVVAYPLERHGQFNLVLTQPDSTSEDGKMVHGLVGIDIEHVRKKFEDWDPRLRAILEMAPKASQSTLGQINDLDSWFDKGNKLVLLGDSVHPMLPYLSVLNILTANANG